MVVNQKDKECGKDVEEVSYNTLITCLCVKTLALPSS